MTKLIYDGPPTIVGKYSLCLEAGAAIEVEPDVAADVVEHTESVPSTGPDPADPQKTIVILTQEPRGIPGLRPAPGQIVPKCRHCAAAEQANGVAPSTPALLGPPVQPPTPKPPLGRATVGESAAAPPKSENQPAASRKEE
jgi:hypothetical protein